MSDAENDEPATNTNGKRVNALMLGPRKKVYVFYYILLHHHDRLLLAPKEIHSYIMAGTSVAPYMPCATSRLC